jgi:dihydropteroate synthase
MQQTTPCIMGVLNITPDSFSDGGRFLVIEKAVERAYEMVESGAFILDVGAESSRPGAQKIDADTEKARLLPILPALLHAFKDILGKKLLISLDTYKAETMHWALDLGVNIINDISGFSHQKSIQTIANYDCQVCIMHMQNQPYNMQNNPHYSNIIEEVHDFLCQQTLMLYQKGIAPERMILDVGFGFGKSLAHNTALLNHLEDFKCLDYFAFFKRQHNYFKKDKENNLKSIQMMQIDEIQSLTHALMQKKPRYLNLVGISNKTMVGDVTNRPIDQRQAGNNAFHLIALQKGADILRVHDVAAAVDVLKVYQHFT